MVRADGDWDCRGFFIMGLLKDDLAKAREKDGFVKSSRCKARKN
jgi:hypothetical protein